MQNVDATDWKKHWVLEGLKHLEAMLDSPETGKFCHGDTLSLADCCLVPQVWPSVADYTKLSCPLDLGRIFNSRGLS